MRRVSFPCVALLVFACEPNNPESGDSADTRDFAGADILTTDEVGDGETVGSGYGGVPLELGEAANYVVLAERGVTTVAPTIVMGDVGSSPAPASTLTGFSLTLDPTRSFSTSEQVTGRLFAADGAAPTPTRLSGAIAAMELAFTDAAAWPADVEALGDGDIGGMVLAPGVYAWDTSLIIPADVTLYGSETDQWIMQIAGDLTLGRGVEIVLEGGAQAQNVVWQVDGSVEFGATSHAAGVVLGRTSITLHRGASIEGRLLAQTTIILDAATVIAP